MAIIKCHEIISRIISYQRLVNRELLRNLLCQGPKFIFAMFTLKGRSHYSDNQSPTSDNHYFWGGCRRLSEVGKCLSMIGDWLSENYIDNLSPTSDNHPFSGWFSMVGKWLLMIAEQFWSARGFRCSINNHRQPNKAAIQNEYTKGLRNMKMMEK